MRIDVSTLPAAVAAGLFAFTKDPSRAKIRMGLKVPAQLGTSAGNKHRKT
jgi:hypothetical protein